MNPPVIIFSWWWYSTVPANMTKMQQVRLQPTLILPFSFYSYRRKKILGIFALFLRLSYVRVERDIHSQWMNSLVECGIDFVIIHHCWTPIDILQDREISFCDNCHHYSPVLSGTMIQTWPICMHMAFLTTSLYDCVILNECTQYLAISASHYEYLKLTLVLLS